MLGINSETPDDSLTDPVQILRRLRNCEDLIPRDQQEFIEPYEKDESSSQGSSEMFQEWRAKKAAKRKEAQEKMAEYPVFAPVYKESETSLQIVVTEMENSPGPRQQPMTVGGVRLNRDDSRSFI